MPRSILTELPPCTISGCANKAPARGLCHKHYMRWRRRGSPDDPARPYRLPSNIKPGSTIGFWTVLEKTWYEIPNPTPKGRRRGAWLCRCVCGTESVVLHYNLLIGESTSCGCQANDSRRKTLSTHGRSKIADKTYKSWEAMKARCFNPKHREYGLYGGRGITVCSRWKESFEIFLADMGERPKGHSIDRIDYNGNYEPSNCRWATIKVQSRNRRNNLYFTINGVTKCLADWCEEYSAPWSRTYNRIQRGWDIMNALTRPKGYFLFPWWLRH